MCFDADSHPPIDPIAGGALDHESVVLKTDDGSEIRAFAARPTQPTGSAILILPDVRGLHPFFEELTLRFAEHGIAAVAIDYFGRTAGTGERGEDFEYMPHVQQTRVEQVQLDIAAALDALRERTGVRGAVTVGFCFGGSHSFAAATSPDLDLAAAVGFYGRLVPAREGAPAPLELAAQTRCPVLGLFGGADAAIPAEDVDAFDRGLDESGVEHEMVTYPGAPHSFFDRAQAEHAEASEDAWRRVLAFLRNVTVTA
jgi:carboxymethylenebutenolidase